MPRRGKKIKSISRKNVENAKGIYPGVIDTPQARHEHACFTMFCI
jgi:hypothetical protein